MEKVLDASKTDEATDCTLRPSSLDEYIGQDSLKDNLKIFIGAALHRNEVLDHVLLYGPPGLGKTTLAHAIAHEMRTNIKVITATTIEKTGDLAALLSEIEAGDILFIDEIHRLPKIIEESLYSAMEDFRFDIVISRDYNAKSISIDLPPFTLIGATTRAGSLSNPLRARFGIKAKLNFYSEDEISQIIRRTAKVFNTKIDERSVKEISKRSRGTPRIANHIFKRIRDFVNYLDRDEINYDDTNKALQSIKIDKIGLDEVDISYLKTLIFRFNGGPVGLETLADAIGEEIRNLEDVNEPYLIQLGFIDRTPKGRVATEKSYRHLKVPKGNKIK